MFAGLCSSIHLRRLKIPWEQSREGSSPFPSNPHYQYVRRIQDCVSKSKICLRTQFLRNQPKHISINAKIAKFNLAYAKPIHPLFLRGKRGRRGARGKSLPRTAKSHSVADVATLPKLAIISSAQIVQFYVELRKKCVIQRFNKIRIAPHNIIDKIIQGIADPLLLSILDFITLFHFMRGTYGNDS